MTLNLSDDSNIEDEEDDGEIGYLCHHNHEECVGELCVKWRTDVHPFFAQQLDSEDSLDPTLHCLDVRLQQLNVELIEAELLRRVGIDANASVEPQVNPTAETTPESQAQNPEQNLPNSAPLTDPPALG